MINYERFTLKNGLRVLMHEDKSSPMVAVNICYDVGARDESPERTGFAHLFEHLMFSGTADVPDFDEPLQMAGGENNAFTNNDITNFYELVPADNLEVALWLESDRMHNIIFDEHRLDVQRKVVVEEFKETCLNEPYGDVWHHMSALAYKKHPYRWPVIGSVPEHISEASLEDVLDFYQKFYQPNNAVLVIAGNVSSEALIPLVEKWFGHLPNLHPPLSRQLPIEPPQQAPERKVCTSNAPGEALYLAFHVPDRTHRDYCATDLLSDVLGNGSSSRLYQQLVRQKGLVSNVDCYISGTTDPGLLVIEAKPIDGVSVATVRNAVWQILIDLKAVPLAEEELTKVKNKAESTLVFSEMSILNKAINLAYFETLGDAELINKEADFYRQVSAQQLQRLAQEIFREQNCSEVVYQHSKAMS